MRYIFVYGIISGLVVIAAMMIGIFADSGGFFASEVFGYLVMLVALTLIFVGIKRYRDVERGGVIGFGRALALGLGIAAVAGIAYVAVWESYLASTGYAFMNDYVAAAIEAKRAEGLSGAVLAREIAALEELRTSYANPLFRLPMTFLEIFPVGLIVALVSAAILRNPRAFPAHGRAAA